MTAQLLAGADTKRRGRKRRGKKGDRDLGGGLERRHSALMKCILHYLSAVRWQLSADKIVTDVVRDSVAVECEHSAPDPSAPLTLCLCAPVCPRWGGLNPSPRWVSELLLPVPVFLNCSDDSVLLTPSKFVQSHTCSRADVFSYVDFWFFW